MKRRITRSLLLLPLMTGCGDEGASPDAGWAGTIDTLPNGAIHVQNPRGGVWDSTTAWTLEEEWRIGGMDGTGPEIFGQVRDLAIDELGRVYVLDNQARQIRVFDIDGSFVRSIGRDGEGPGEFRNPNGIEWDHRGRLWAADARIGRYAVFDTTGAFIEDYPRPIMSWGYAWDVGFDDSGHLYEHASRPPDDEGSRAPVVVRLNSIAAPIDSFPLPRIADLLMYSSPMPGRPDMMMSVTAVPFTPRQYNIIDRDGSLWFGNGDGYRIVRQTLGGDTLLIIDRDYDPVPVTPQERSEALARDFIQQIREQGGDVDPDLIPTQKPAYGGFLQDPEGFLWVFTTPRQPGVTVFDMFDASGRYLGRMQVDEEIANPTIRGNAMYGVVTDDLDVPYIVRWRIAGR